MTESQRFKQAYFEMPNHQLFAEARSWLDSNFGQWHLELIIDELEIRLNNKERHHGQKDHAGSIDNPVPTL